MTITQLRNEFKARIRFDELTKSGLSDYLKQEWKTLETLYAEGAVSRRTDYISDDMLALAAGYDPQKENSGFTVVRCLDLAYIYATKKHVRNMMMLFLGISEPQKSAHAEQEQQETVKETESAPEQTSEQEQQEEPGNQNNAVSKYTDEMLVEIYKNLKTSAKILGFASASDSEMMTEIELEAIKRHINLPDGAVEPQKEEISKQANAETDTYEHAIEMAMYAAECGDGVQAIYHKDGKFKAGLLADRTYATQNGWQYFHTVWKSVPEEERTKQQKHDQIKEAIKKSLFWSRRLSYKSADSHPEWREKYKSAKQELEKAKAELNKEETIMSMNTTTAPEQAEKQTTPTSEPEEQWAVAETKVTQVAELENTYEHAVEMASTKYDWFKDVFLQSLYSTAGHSEKWLTAKQTAICTQYMERSTTRIETATGYNNHDNYVYNWDGREVILSYSKKNGCGTIWFGLNAEEQEQAQIENEAEKRQKIIETAQRRLRRSPERYYATLDKMKAKIEHYQQDIEDSKEEGDTDGLENLISYVEALKNELDLWESLADYPDDPRNKNA